MVETPGAPTLYFAGDTNVFGDMALIGRIYAPDVAVLPIGDHFTMGPREAAVAAELVGASRVVPCHYATFPLLTGTPDALRDAAARRDRARRTRARRDRRAVTRRERWFGRTGRKVPEIALAGTVDLTGAVELDGVGDVEALRRAHARRHPRRRQCAAPPRRSPRRSPGPRSRACSSPTRRCSGSTSPISRMAESAARRDVLDLRLRSRRGPVGRRHAVEVPRGRLGRSVGGTRRGRDRDPGVRQPALRARGARAAPRAAARPPRSSSASPRPTTAATSGSSASSTRPGRERRSRARAAIAWAGGRAGAGFAAQGNILVSAATVDALVETFAASAGRPLGERLIDCLAAAQAAGGDSRGQQSAALARRRARRRLRRALGHADRPPRRRPRAAGRGATATPRPPPGVVREDAARRMARRWTMRFGRRSTSGSRGSASARSRIGPRSRTWRSASTAASEIDPVVLAALRDAG